MSRTLIWYTGISYESTSNLTQFQLVWSSLYFVRCAKVVHMYTTSSGGINENKVRRTLFGTRELSYENTSNLKHFNLVCSSHYFVRRAKIVYLCTTSSGGINANKERSTLFGTHKLSYEKHIMEQYLISYINAFI